MTGEPIAWLIRETLQNSRGVNAAPISRVISGRMFISRESAEAAASRLTSRFRLCQAFPVFNPTREQLKALDAEKQ